MPLFEYSQSFSYDQSLKFGRLKKVIYKLSLASQTLYRHVHDRSEVSGHSCTHFWCSWNVLISVEFLLDAGCGQNNIEHVKLQAQRSLGEIEFCLS